MGALSPTGRRPALNQHADSGEQKGLYQGPEIPAFNRPEAGEGSADRQKRLAASRWSSQALVREEAMGWQSAKESQGAGGTGSGWLCRETEICGAQNLAREVWEPGKVSDREFKWCQPGWPTSPVQTRGKRWIKFLTAKVYREELEIDPDVRKTEACLIWGGPFNTKLSAGLWKVILKETLASL